MRGGIVALGALLVAAPVGAQCPLADKDQGGSITIDEVVTVVKAALDGCAATPTTEPTSTGTPTPTETATVVPDTPTPTASLTPLRADGCLDFFENRGTCAFRGRWNDTCGSDQLIVRLQEFGFPEDELFGSRLELGIKPPWEFLALAATETIGVVHVGGQVGFQLEDILGAVELSNNGRRLQVWIIDKPSSVRIDGCRFEHFDGAFLH